MKLLALPKFLNLPVPSETRPRGDRRRRAARCVAAGLAWILFANLGFLAVLDYGPAYLRDPEYGKRISRYHARTLENPGKPVVAVVGSSRVAMGVRGGVRSDSDPLVLNFALAGSGPIMELMTVRRMLADGAKPDLVLLEFWPAFLREDGPYHESARIDVTRLRPIDRDLVREFYPNPTRTQTQMREQRINPWFSHRHSLWNEMAASWLLPHRRTDAMFEKIDGWGWLPGKVSATEKEREGARQGTANYYVPLFASYHISPDAARALRQAVSECRAAGIPVGLIYMPEAGSFRALMTPAAVRESETFLARIRSELAVPLIDARGWVPDDDLPDGFHLTQAGAAEFTKRLMPAVRATFPELQRGSR